MKTTHEPQFVKSSSHWIEEDYGAWKEEVYLDFDATWRGRTTLVVMWCRRYRHSSGISEWNIFAHSAIESGNSLSDLARGRLSEQIRPYAQAWLESDAYKISESEAYFYLIKLMLRRSLPYLDNATADSRSVIEKYRSKLTLTQVNHLLAIADAYDTFSNLYNKNPYETN